WRSVGGRYGRPFLPPRPPFQSLRVPLAMQIHTTRFGLVEIDMADILLFPHGVIAFEDCRHWVLLGDEGNESLGWLQSITRGEVALAVVSPRRFAPAYHVHVTRGQLSSLELSQFDSAYVLSVVSKSDGELTLNLKAPIVVNLDRRLGRQGVTTDEQPVAVQLRPPARGPHKNGPK